MSATPLDTTAAPEAETQPEPTTSRGAHWAMRKWSDNKALVVQFGLGTAVGAVEWILFFKIGESADLYVRKAFPFSAGAIVAAAALVLAIWPIISSLKNGQRRIAITLGVIVPASGLLVMLLMLIFRGTAVGIFNINGLGSIVVPITGLILLPFMVFRIAGFSTMSTKLGKLKAQLPLLLERWTNAKGEDERLGKIRNAAEVNVGQAETAFSNANDIVRRAGKALSKAEQFQKDNPSPEFLGAEKAQKELSDLVKAKKNADQTLTKNENIDLSKLSDEKKEAFEELVLEAKQLVENYDIDYALAQDRVKKAQAEVEKSQSTKDLAKLRKARDDADEKLRTAKLNKKAASKALAKALSSLSINSALTTAHKVEYDTAKARFEKMIVKSQKLSRRLNLNTIVILFVMAICYLPFWGWVAVSFGQGVTA